MCSQRGKALLLGRLTAQLVVDCLYMYTSWSSYYDGQRGHVRQEVSLEYSMTWKQRQTTWKQMSEQVGCN